MSSSKSEKVKMSNNSKKETKKQKKMDIKVFNGFKDSIQVRLNDRKDLTLKNVFVQERKFGQVFTIDDFKQVNNLLLLSSKVEQECKKLHPHMNYSRFSVVDKNNKVRISISDFVETQFEGFNGFTSKSHDYKIDAVCYLKIVKYNKELFLKLVLAGAKLIEKIVKEPWTPQQQKISFESFNALEDYDESSSDIESDEEVVEMLDGKHYDNLDSDEF